MIFDKSVLFTKKELRVFCTYRLLFGIFYSVMIPIIPLYLNSFGIATVMVGTILSFYGVAKTLIQMPFGIISDKFGDKLTLVLAILLMAVIPFSYTLFKTGQAASYLYIIQGGILGMAAPATYSILSRSLDEKKRGECTGLAAAVFTLGGGIGSAIGGLIVTKLNNYNLAFYLSSIGIFLTVLYIIFKIKGDNQRCFKNKNKNATNKVKFKDMLYEIKKYKLFHKILVLGSIAFLGDYIYGCVVALIHFYAKSILNTSTAYSSAIISIYLMVFGIGAPIAGFIADKIGNNKQLILSFFVMDITLLCLSFIRNVPTFTVVIILYFLGATFLNAALQSSLSEFGNSPKIKGIVSGFVGGCESFGYAVGPLVSAYIYNINHSFLFLSLLGASLLISLIYFIFHKKANI
ncbi:MFS transporter [Terrisporobacter mayombei]|uniref:Glycolipid permease LtaA n=1 Tax=Terrisporobacter mayombei TaxID=1541 RepID=A0ABY9Q661_9FIRM|nr:MFS transporter [Terrisporobacter mayombei]MCC3868827.1 MFS transporter [Terrisporobacter mayombei]WMT83041.1 putative glycolipid permease LtaA [Terrisporobacter mayombei]